MKSPLYDTFSLFQNSLQASESSVYSSSSRKKKDNKPLPCPSDQQSFTCLDKSFIIVCLKLFDFYLTVSQDALLKMMPWSLLNKKTWKILQKPLILTVSVITYYKDEIILKLKI